MKKRKSKRFYFDKENESHLPARRTKEIATTHLNSESTEDNTVLEVNEEGKELFDYVLTGMSSPENDSPTD